MTKLTIAAALFLWIGAASAFLDSPTTAFVQDIYGKASIYHQKKRIIESHDSRNQVVHFLSDIYGLASSTPYHHPKRETRLDDSLVTQRHHLSSKMMNDPYGLVASSRDHHAGGLLDDSLVTQRHHLSPSMMNDPYGVVASSRDHHAGGLFERENKARAIKPSYVLPTDHGNHVVFDLNAQREALEAQFQRPAVELPVLVHARPSLVLPTDRNGNTVVFDMHQQLNAIQAQFMSKPQDEVHHAAPAVAVPQAITAHTPSVEDHLTQLQEHAQLMEQQELGIVNEPAAAAVLQ